MERMVPWRVLLDNSDEPADRERKTTVLNFDAEIYDVRKNLTDAAAARKISHVEKSFQLTVTAVEFLF
jgi:hypothetical protein